jgi:hypothetical protein
MSGLLTIGNISLGIDFVAGRNRVPYPAAGNRHFLMLVMTSLFLLGVFEAAEFIIVVRLKARRLSKIIIHWLQTGQGNGSMEPSAQNLSNEGVKTLWRFSYEP